MRIKVLMAGDDTAVLETNMQLLKNRGIYVYTVSDLENIPEAIAEVKPDVILFDVAKMSYPVTEAYNNTINSIYYKDIPVIFNLPDVDTYLVTRKRTWFTDRKNITADNAMDAIKMAMTTEPYLRKRHFVTKENIMNTDTRQLSIYAE